MVFLVFVSVRLWHGNSFFGRPKGHHHHPTNHTRMHAYIHVVENTIAYLCSIHQPSIYIPIHIHPFINQFRIEEKRTPNILRFSAAAVYASRLTSASMPYLPHPTPKSIPSHFCTSLSIYLPALVFALSVGCYPRSLLPLPRAACKVVNSKKDVCVGDFIYFSFHFLGSCLRFC